MAQRWISAHFFSARMRNLSVWTGYAADLRWAGAVTEKGGDMYLFSRVLTLSASPRQAMPWLAEVTSYVNEHTDLDATLWGANFGYPVGTVGWSTVVESRAQLAAATAGLQADDAYWDIVENATDMIEGPAEDALRMIVHGGPGEEGPAVGAVAAVTTATAAGGKMGAAMEWGVMMAELGTSVGGSPVTFLADSYGTFGQVTWVATFDDMVAVDAATGAMMADDEYRKRLDEAGDVFLPASGHRGLMTRLL